MICAICQPYSRELDCSMSAGRYPDAGFGEGAKALVGGKRYGDRGYFFELTMLVDTQPTMKVVQEEIFDPVVTAMPFDDPDDLIRVANDTVYGWRLVSGRAISAKRTASPRRYGPGRCGSIAPTSSMRLYRAAATNNPARGERWAIMRSNCIPSEVRGGGLIAISLGNSAIALTKTGGKRLRCSNGYTALFTVHEAYTRGFPHAHPYSQSIHGPGVGGCVPVDREGIAQPCSHDRCPIHMMA
jgi:aldehyde dehydrogenase family protein